MPTLTEELDRLVHTLETGTATAAGTADAIDAVLASPARTSEIRVLRHDPIIEAFRRELTDGLVRVDTANQLLSLVNTVLTTLLTR
jgi:hypothetical protein